MLSIAVGQHSPGQEVDLLTAIMTEDAMPRDQHRPLALSRCRHRPPTGVSRTAAAIVALDNAGFDSESACGCDALRLCIVWARGAGLDARRLDLRNSADTAGDPRNVEGYGAFAIERAATG